MDLKFSHNMIETYLIYCCCGELTNRKINDGSSKGLMMRRHVCVY